MPVYFSSLISRTTFCAASSNLLVSLRFSLFVLVFQTLSFYPSFPPNLSQMYPFIFILSSVPYTVYSVLNLILSLALLYMQGLQIRGAEYACMPLSFCLLHYKCWINKCSSPQVATQVLSNYVINFYNEYMFSHHVIHKWLLLNFSCVKHLYSLITRQISPICFIFVFCILFAFLIFLSTMYAFYLLWNAILLPLFRIIELSSPNIMAPLGRS